MFRWLKKLVKSVLRTLVNWFSKKIRKPRLWTGIEWKKLTPKEKCWIWYKHVLYIKGVGSAEVDQVTNPIKDWILYGGIVLSNITLAMTALGLKIDYFAIVGMVGLTVIVLWIVNFVWQLNIGDWKDANDLIALESEITNKRNLFCRDLRKATKKEEWRQKITSESKAE